MSISCHEINRRVKRETSILRLSMVRINVRREFDFPSILRMFDFLVSWPRGKRDALLRLCSAMVCNVERELMDEHCDFAVAMRTLQNYPASRCQQDYQNSVRGSHI